MNNNQNKKNNTLTAEAVKSQTNSLSSEYKFVIEENIALKLDLEKIKSYSEQVASVLGQVNTKLTESGLKEDFKFSFRYIITNWKKIGSLIEAIVLILKYVR